MGIYEQLRARAIVARSNVKLGERPDRVVRSIRPVLRYGGSLLGAVAMSCARYPNALALVGGDRQLTYRQLWLESTALAHGLRDAHIGPTSRVGVLCKNTPLFAEIVLAAAKLGADLVFLNTGMAGPQLTEVIASEGIDAVISDSEFVGRLAGCADVTTIDSDACQRMIESGATRDLGRPSRPSQLVILTSGTTGRPKGAARPSGGSSIEGVAALLGCVPIRVRDTIFVAAPFFHAWGLANLLIGLGTSATVVLRDTFDAGETIDLVEKYGAQVLVVVPVMLQRICALDPRMLAASPMTSLRAIVTSGSALPAHISIEVLDRYGPVLYNVYGSTEIATATVATPSDLRRAPTTAGRPAPGVRIRLYDEHSVPVARGEVGRIFVGTGARFDGYTAGGSKSEINGLLSSGDIGHFDEYGCLHIDGREDDMIVSGGENVYPIEIEELLATHPDIQEAIVVGVRDPEFGQTLKAVVVPRPGSQLDADSVKEYVHSRLARYKVPRAVEFVDEMPRNATGKILRKDIR